MDLWNRIAGVIYLEITVADPHRFLNLLARQNVVLWDTELISPIRIRTGILRSHLKILENLADKMGGSVTHLGTMGFAYKIRRWMRRPVPVICLVILLVLTVLLPEYILFVDVQGNEKVPTRIILEQAQKQGLHFGANRRALRSEEIKNELLAAVEELEWVGVNTTGCRAIIRVRERDPELLPEKKESGDLVAAADGVIDEIVMHKGILLCKPGQAVKMGDVLVSGLTDVGICSRLCNVQAEIYAFTNRMMETRSRTLIQKKEKTGKETLQIGLIIGKKRINLFADSGIIPRGCDKMTYIYQLRLPGGDTLPVSLVIGRIVWYNISNTMRQQEDAQQMMEDTARQYLREHTISAEILNCEIRMEYGESGSSLQTKFQCREMIARLSAASILEGDTQDDSKNSQRGAG